MAEAWKPPRPPWKQVCSCKVEGSDITYVVPVPPHVSTCFEVEDKLKAKFGREVDCELERFGWDW